MKFKIVHESRGRIRMQVIQNRMTLEQALHLARCPAGHRA